MLAVAGAVALAACSTRSVSPEPERDAVAAAMDHYLAMLKLVNSDSVAAMFTDSTEMYQPAAPPIRGRDAVRAFLKPFDGHAHVDTVTATTIATECVRRRRVSVGDVSPGDETRCGASGEFRRAIRGGVGAGGGGRVEDSADADANGEIGTAGFSFQVSGSDK